MYACMGKLGQFMSLWTKRTFSLPYKLWILPKNCFFRVNSETADSPYFGHARRYSADIVTAPENLNSLRGHENKFSLYLIRIPRTKLFPATFHRRIEMESSAEVPVTIFPVVAQFLWTYVLEFPWKIVFGAISGNCYILAFRKRKNNCNILKKYSATRFCPQETEIARFPIGFRLNKQHSYH